MLTARINSSASTTTVGSCALAFLPDPADPLPKDGVDTVKWVMAQQYSVTGKWHDNLVLPIPMAALRGPFGRFFKVEDAVGSDIRTCSPGRLVFVSIINPTSGDDVPIQIDVEWDVTLRGAALPPTVKQVPDLVFSCGATVRCDDNPDTAYDPLLQKDITSSWMAIKEVDSTLNHTNIGSLFTLPAPFTLVGNTGSQGAPVATVCTHIGYKSANAFALYGTSRGKCFEVNKENGQSCQPTTKAAPSWPAGTRFPYAGPITQQRDGESRVKPDESAESDDEYDQLSDSEVADISRKMRRHSLMYREMDRGSDSFSRERGPRYCAS